MRSDKSFDTDAEPASFQSNSYLTERAINGKTGKAWLGPGIRGLETAALGCATALAIFRGNPSFHA